MKSYFNKYRCKVYFPSQNDIIPIKKTIDRKYFFDIIREEGLFKKITKELVKSIDVIFDTWDDNVNLNDLRWLAYMLATTYHETAFTMQPIKEWGKGRGRRYGNKIKHSGKSYNYPDKIYYGRGFVQLTWYENYELMGRLLDVDLLNKPELALDLKIATKILFEGMLRGNSNVGDFTGKCLEIYFNEDKEDWVNARRIINGLDKANKIAEYGKLFNKCLKYK